MESKMRLIDADALYNGAMKDEYFDYVEHDNHGRESFVYSCAMQRLAEAPTIDAIPVEWLKEHDGINIIDSDGNIYARRRRTVEEALSMWQKEQEEEK